MLVEKMGNWRALWLVVLWVAAMDVVMVDMSGCRKVGKLAWRKVAQKESN